MLLGKHISIKMQKVAESKSDSCFVYNITTFYEISTKSSIVLEVLAAPDAKYIVSISVL